MQPHGGAAENDILVEEEPILMSSVDEIKIPFANVRGFLLQQGVFQDLHDFCLQCSSNPEVLYPKIFPLIFYKIFSYMDGYKHLFEEK